MLENDDEMPDYKDLGREYFDFIQVKNDILFFYLFFFLKEEYKKRNPIKCYDPIVLFQFWKGLRLSHVFHFNANIRRN